MARPSIAFVAPHAYPVLAGTRELRFVGGAEVQQVAIATELVRRGYRVSMLSLDYGQREGELVRGIRLLKMCTPNGGWPGVRYLYPRLTSLWGAMRRAAADVYYQRSSGAATGFVAAFTRRHDLVSIFAGAHDSDFEPALPLIRYARDRMLYRWGLRHVSRVVAQTERQQQRCLEVFGREAMRIDSCYAHRGAPAQHDGVILWVATIKPSKQPELLVELAARLPQYRFRMVGGPESGAAAQELWRRLQARAAELPNLELTGFVAFADVEPYFDGASLFVNTSSGEGFPNTFLQAWSRGMPTVSFFDAGATVDGVGVGRVAGSVGEMALAVQSLKCDRDAWNDAGSRARRRFERHHSPQIVVDAYEGLILDAAAGGKALRRTPT